MLRRRSRRIAPHSARTYRQSRNLVFSGRATPSFIISDVVLLKPGA